jgi:ABC-type branched-subunit amino acid transport system ATPase component
MTDGQPCDGRTSPRYAGTSMSMASVNESRRTFRRLTVATELNVGGCFWY